MADGLKRSAFSPLFISQIHLTWITTSVLVCPGKVWLFSLLLLSVCCCPAVFVLLSLSLFKYIFSSSHIFLFIQQWLTSSWKLSSMEEQCLALQSEPFLLCTPVRWSVLTATWTYCGETVKRWLSYFVLSAAGVFLWPRGAHWGGSGS